MQGGAPALAQQGAGPQRCSWSQRGRDGCFRCVLHPHSQACRRHTAVQIRHACVLEQILPFAVTACAASISSKQWLNCLLNSISFVPEMRSGGACVVPGFPSSISPRMPSLCAGQQEPRTLCPPTTLSAVWPALRFTLLRMKEWSDVSFWQAQACAGLQQAAHRRTLTRAYLQPGQLRANDAQARQGSGGAPVRQRCRGGREPAPPSGGHGPEDHRRSSPRVRSWLARSQSSRTRAPSLVELCRAQLCLPKQQPKTPSDNRG